MAKKCSECSKKVKFLKGEYYTPAKGKQIFLCNECLKKVKDGELKPNERLAPIRPKFATYGICLGIVAILLFLHPLLGLLPIALPHNLVSGLIIGIQLILALLTIVFGKLSNSRDGIASIIIGLIVLIISGLLFLFIIIPSMTL